MNNDVKLKKLEAQFLEPDYVEQEFCITCPECGNTYTYDEVEDNWGTDVLTSYGEEFYHDMCPNCIENLMDEAHEQLRIVTMKWFFEVNKIPCRDVTNNSYFKCKCCDKWHLNENATKAPDGRRYNFCVDCADKDIAYYNNDLKEMVVEAYEKKCSVLQLEEQENKVSIIAAPNFKEACVIMMKRFIPLSVLKKPLKKSLTLSLLKRPLGAPVKKVEKTLETLETKEGERKNVTENI